MISAHLPTLRNNPANLRLEAIRAAVGAAEIVKCCQALSDTHELHNGDEWIPG